MRTVSELGCDVGQAGVGYLQVVPQTFASLRENNIRVRLICIVKGKSPPMNRRKFLHLLALSGAAAALPIQSLADSSNELDTEEYSLQFHPPEEGWDYTIGVHPGFLSGHSVISVWGQQAGDFPLIQCFEWSGRGSEHLLDAAIEIGNQYSKFLPGGPLFSIEQVTGPGDVLQDQLRRVGFSRFYMMARRDKKSTEGWYTTSWSRPLTIQTFLFYLESGWAIERSRRLTRDLNGATYARVDKKYVLALPNAPSDNRFIAAAIAVSTSQNK